MTSGHLHLLDSYMNTEQARFNMIEQQIRPANVLDSAVLALLNQVHREDFVPAAHKSLAFMDIEIPLPGGRAMLSPKIEARLIESLALSKKDNVLLIGSGSGYEAALAAHLAHSVTVVEDNAELFDFARLNVQRAGLGNVHFIKGDVLQGHAAQAPYSAILLTGSVNEVPDALVDQIKPDGRLLAVVGREPVMQAWLVRRAADGHLSRQALFDTVIAPLDGVPVHEPFVL